MPRLSGNPVSRARVDGADVGKQSRRGMASASKIGVVMMKLAPLAKILTSLVPRFEREGGRDVPGLGAASLGHPRVGLRALHRDDRMFPPTQVRALALRTVRL